MNKYVTARALRTAADAVERLEDERIRVLGHYHNGRKPVLLVERKPRQIEGVVIRRQPMADGVQRVFAAPFAGVQIEWHEFVPAVREVTAHAC